MSNSNSDNLFNGLVGQALNKAIDSTNEKNTSAQIRLILALAGILFFVGVEAVKIVFRKNFGIKGINMLRLIICFLCFLAIGIIGIGFGISGEMKDIDMDVVWFTPSSFIVCGAGYIFLAFYMLRKGIRERQKAIKNQLYNNFTSESDLLKVLTEYGWSQNKIQYLAEPLYTLCFGITLALYNPIAAIPVVFCALSVWAHAALEFLFVQNPFQPDITMPQQSQPPHPNQPIKPNRVDTDF